MSTGDGRTSDDPCARHGVRQAGGRPAIALYRIEGEARTHAEDRRRPMPTAAATRRCSRATAFATGEYELVFAAGDYLRAQGVDAARAGLPRRRADPLRHGRADALPCAAARLALRLFDLSGELSHGQAEDPQRDPLHPQRRGRGAVPMSRRTRRCSTICGCAARCAAPRKAAPRAIAAPAPCWSAGCRDGKLVYEGVNACIRFPRLARRLPCRHRRASARRRTASLHPVQQAMVDFHGSQCGFCTPGFVMSLYGLWMTNRRRRPTRRSRRRCRAISAAAPATRRSCARRARSPSYGKAAKDPLAAERKAVTARLDGDARRRARRDRRGQAAADRAGRSSTISPTCSRPSRRPRSSPARPMSGCG